MHSFLNDVSSFHSLIGATVATDPRLLSCDQEIASEVSEILRDALAKIAAKRCQDELVGRMELALEELCEWVEAHAKSDIVATADAWGDRFYVLLGDAVATGMPVEDIFHEIHQSNMTKIGPEKGEHKGVKASRFTRPQLAKFIKP